MARKDRELSLPGNDGRWFLELTGVVESPPSPTSTYTELEALDPPPALVASETAAVTAGVAAVSGSLASETSGDEFIPVTPPRHDGLDDWRPDAVSRRLGRRGFGRLLAIGLVVVVIAAVAAAVVMVPRAVQHEADALASEYHQALADLRNELPRSQAALADLTDPTSTQDAVSASVPAIGDLNTRALVVIGHATADLPSTPPLVPRSPLEALEPTRTRMLILGAEAEGISGQLATTFAYQSAVPAMFPTPPLPTEADSATVDALSIALAESLAETARLIAELPPDPTFEETRDLALAASERYATWQIEYLDAVREGDAEQAAALVADLERTRAEITDALADALAIVRAETDPRIIELARETELAIAAIP